ncbi:methyltransferase domain-containing protein [Candidatus Woesearchaeota archaeon]|nr:methyltransferase domain-containing protein [Candidatus Woesearchaeota archaeon]
MEYKELIKKLSSSEGEEASKIMKELGQFLTKCTPGQRTTFSAECISAIPKANEKRKGSLGFLIALANINRELITDLLRSESPIIREQTIKGLLHQGEEYILELETRLKEEKLYRIKKWILLTLGNVGTKKAIKIIEEAKIEPQIFSTKEKILSQFKQEKKHNQKITGKGGLMLVQTVMGAEESFLEHYDLRGVRFGGGIIQLDGEFEFDDFAKNRSIFHYGVFLGRLNEIENVVKKRFGEKEQYCVEYTNEIHGEKERLSEFQAELSKQGFEYNSKAPLILRLLNEDEGMLLIKPLIKENLEYLPASINRVVASVVNLVSENEHGKANIILDPCCGSATLLCEHHAMSEQRTATKNKSRDEHVKKYVGIDKDKEAIEKAKKNSEEYKLKIELHNKKFQEVLPTRAADLVFCNPPFDIRIKEYFDYNELVKFISRNTTKNMTAIIYTVKKQDLRDACENNNLEIIKEIKLKLKKISPSIFIIKKLN